MMWCLVRGLSSSSSCTRWPSRVARLPRRCVVDASGTSAAGTKLQRLSYGFEPLVQRLETLPIAKREALAVMQELPKVYSRAVERARHGHVAALTR